MEKKIGRSLEYQVKITPEKEKNEATSFDFIIPAKSEKYPVIAFLVINQKTKDFFRIFPIGYLVEEGDTIKTNYINIVPVIVEPEKEKVEPFITINKSANEVIRAYIEGVEGRVKKSIEELSGSAETVLLLVSLPHIINQNVSELLNNSEILDDLSPIDKLVKKTLPMLEEIFKTKIQNNDELRKIIDENKKIVNKFIKSDNEVLLLIKQTLFNFAIGSKMIRDTAARLDLILKKAALLKSMKHKIYPTHLKPLTETTISTTKIENMKEFVLSTLTNLYTRTEEVVKRIKEKLQLSDNEIEENYFRKYFPIFITSERQNMAVLAAIKDIGEVVNKVIEETINPILDEVEKLKKSFEDRELLKLYLRLLGRVRTRQNVFLAMRRLNRNNPEKLQKIEEFINKITNIDDKEIIKTIITQRNIIRKKLMSSFKKVRNVFTNTVFELLGFLYLIGGLSEEEKQKLKEIVGEEIFDLPEDAEPIIKPNQKKELVDKIINISERYANFLESFSSNEILEDIEKIKKSITGESGLRRYYFCSASTGTMLWGEVFVIEKENTKNLYIYVEDISWTRPIKQRMLTFVPISKEINLRIEDIIRNIQLTREVYRKGNITNKKINLRFKRILKEIEFFPYIDKSEEILKPINEAILKEQRYGIYLFYYINEKLDELAGTVKNIWTTLNKQNDKELENKLKEIKENIETVQNIIKWNREQNIKSIYYTFSIGRIIDDILEIPPRKHETTIYLPQLPKVMLILYDQKLNIGTVAEKRYKTIKLDNKEIIENALMNIDIEEYINEWNISIEEKNRFIMAVDNAINTIENKENFMNFIHNLIEKLWNAINENISSERLIPSFKKAKTEEEKKNTEKLKLIRKAYITNKLVIDIIMDMLMGIAGDNI